METTAEGVETLDELDLVRMLGCSHIQGFIYDRPLTASAASARLETGLIAIAKGPRASRARRHTMLRKVVLDHGGERYQGTIRNISSSGAMIEGLWNVPTGTTFDIQISESRSIRGTTRWSQQDRIGVQLSPNCSNLTKPAVSCLPRRAQCASPARVFCFARQADRQEPAARSGLARPGPR